MPRLTPSGLRAFTTVLPLAYLEILDKEGELFGLSRGKFLEMLVRRKAGQISLQRSERAPTYEFAAHELAEREQWTWYCKPDAGEIFEKDVFRLGGIPYTAWIIWEVNKWLGCPDGFTERRNRYVAQPAGEAPGGRVRR